MASTNKTPNLNLPQWVGTDKPERTDFNAAFSDVDSAIGSQTYTEQNYVTDGETLTDSIDALDVGLNDVADIESDTNLTMTNGWIANSAATYGSPRYYKDRGRVYLAGFVTGASKTTNDIATLPIGYRPPYRYIMYIKDAAGATNAMVVLPDGVIQCASASILSLFEVSFKV